MIPEQSAQVPPSKLQKNLVTVTALLPESQVNWLLATAERENITVTDVIRRAINAERFFVDQETHNRKILIEYHNHCIHEVTRN